MQKKDLVLIGAILLLILIAFAAVGLMKEEGA